MAMKRLLAAMFTTAVLAAGCAKPLPERNYVNSEHKFRMNKPEGWSVVGAGEEEVIALKGSVAVLKAPKATDAADAFISVRIVNNLKDSSPRRLYDSQFPALREELKDLTIEERDEEFEATARRACLVTCSFTGDDGALWKGTILYVTSGKRGAVMLCTCFAADYGAYKQAFRSTCRSFFLE